MALRRLYGLDCCGFALREIFFQRCLKPAKREGDAILVAPSWLASAAETRHATQRRAPHRFLGGVFIRGF